MGSRRLVRRLILAAAAAAGVVTGHAATYLLAFRDPTARGTAMADAGHSHWPEMVVAALALGTLALGIVLVRRLREPGARSELGSSLGLAVRLAVVQTLLFVALEVGERLTGGWTPAELASHSLLSVLSLGVLVQVAVGAIVALVLRAAAEVAGVVGRSLRGGRIIVRAVAPRRGAGRWAVGSTVLLAGAWGLRGPPRR